MVACVATATPETLPGWQVVANQRGGSNPGNWPPLANSVEHENPNNTDCASLINQSFRLPRRREGQSASLQSVARRGEISKPLPPDRVSGVENK